ncbi:polyamine acetyltransferase [Hyaloscypha variabilis F]|uniref:Polyamine acetyltransferase n=1 Tax=Hyaloscypha variabilis (strain UAMH 11265 / GT02V1 / F) TaxID=1149755 RepID=A0A2J6S958_HYAVF|nr:polyamine acetyltransferase [Hyaloscypha variabilis F]
MTERSESPYQQEEGSPTAERQQRQFIIIPEEHQLKASSNLTLNLHPYTRPLTISDLESCVALEDAAFTNPEERATREKASRPEQQSPFCCGELCLGIFCTVVPGSGVNAETLATGKPVETSRQNGAISVLLGHVVAAKTNDLVASDQSMGVPEDWDSPHPKPSNLGHQEAGRTIVVHSVAILPAFQGRGLGRVLMMAYMQQMNGAGIADRLALIAHDHKLAWYEKLGFSNKGKSKAQFGGGGWYDLVFELKALEPRATYG